MKRIDLFRAGSSNVRRRFQAAHGGADFGQHTAVHICAKISAITRRRRFRPKLRPSDGDTDAVPKTLREKNLRGEAPQIFFETVMVEQGFMTENAFLN